MAPLDAIVVGAGMAGLVCAQRLHHAGYRIEVLEKSRGLGGRMATRRIEGVPLDHGARFLQPQSKLLTTLTQHLTAQTILMPWQPHSFRLDRAGQLSPYPLTTPCYVASAGISSIGKTLSQGLTIHGQQRAIAIAPTADHWQITTVQADNGESRHHIAKALILAIPAPQISPLLEPLRSLTAIEGMATAIAAMQYAPCITVMAQYASPATPTESPLPCEPTEPWMVEGHPDTPFFWVGLDSGKRQAPNLNVVIHSSAAFAAQWLDAPNLQAAGEALLNAAGRTIAPWLAHPAHWQVHRWRYALVEKPCAQPFLSIREPLSLVACGDWGGDRQIDSALESGWNAAANVNDQLQGKELPESFDDFVQVQ